MYTHESFRAQSLGRVDSNREMVRAVFEVGSDSGRSVQVLPSGPNVIARDGRHFVINNLEAIVAASETPLLIDRDHESENPFGSTRAVGWITALSIKPKGLFGAVEWTPEGERDVRARTYRYISPVLLMDSATHEVLQIISVALTNTPALKKNV
jgi:phage I-like protein